MTRLEGIAAVLVLLLLLPGLVEAKPIGIQIGDKMVYAGEIVKITPGFPLNQTSITTDQFTIRVSELDNLTSAREAAFNMTVDSVNGTAITDPIPAVNYTSIFNPFDNRTYIGSGFYPFVYTDLQNGSVTNLQVTIPLNSTLGSITLPFNASVIRTQASIYVAVAFFGTPNATIPVRWAMQYNATTGVLTKSNVFATFFGTTRNYSYTLVSFERPPQTQGLDLWFLPYAIIAVVVAFVGVTLARRPSRRQRTKARMKERFR